MSSLQDKHSFDFLTIKRSLGMFVLIISVFVTLQAKSSFSACVDGPLIGVYWKSQKNSHLANILLLRPIIQSQLNCKWFVWEKKFASGMIKREKVFDQFSNRVVHVLREMWKLSYFVITPTFYFCPLSLAKKSRPKRRIQISCVLLRVFSYVWQALSTRCDWFVWYSVRIVIGKRGYFGFCL